MMKELFGLVGLILILVSCQNAEVEADSIKKEHSAFVGTWQEVDSTQTSWTFGEFEVKWRGFSHFYTVSNDSLIISGLVYKIIHQSEEKIEMMELNGKQCTLIRKE